MAYFPMFFDINKKWCLVVGGGSVALRKVKVLLDFGAYVSVVAWKVDTEIKKLPVRVSERHFVTEDMGNVALVVAATDDKEFNHKVAEAARSRNIPVNAVDQPEDCTFIFPAYVKRQNVVGAFSSSGNSPVLTQYLKAETMKVLTDELGMINEYMGSIRECVKASFATECERKRVYRMVLEELLKRNDAGQDLQLSESELQGMIGKIQEESLCNRERRK